jgi:hypothetical protein
MQVDELVHPIRALLREPDENALVGHYSAFRADGGIDAGGAIALAGVYTLRSLVLLMI